MYSYWFLLFVSCSVLCGIASEINSTSTSQSYGTSYYPKTLSSHKYKKYDWNKQIYRSYKHRLAATRFHNRPLFSWDLHAKEPTTTSEPVKHYIRPNPGITTTFIKSVNSRYLITDRKPKKRKYLPNRICQGNSCRNKRPEEVEKVNQETNTIPIIGREHHVVGTHRRKQTNDSLITNEVGAGTETDDSRRNLFKVPKMTLNYVTPEEILKREEVLFQHLLTEIQRNVSLSFGNDSACADNRGSCQHVCRVVDGEAVCSCYRGFEQNGFDCIDLDECSVENGGCEQTCINTPGSWRCHCPPGFRLSANNGRCIDINECLLRNGHGPCQDSCHNEVGGYRCSCENLPGTRLGNDNHTCEDLDECTSGTVGCSHTCINTMGQAFCTCPDGWELGEDWKTCQDINECTSEDEVTKCKHGCINTVGSYHCSAQEEATKQPEFTCPDDIVTELDSGRSTANVSFDLPTIKSRDVTCNPEWNMNLSGDLPLGQFKLKFTVKNSADNATAESCHMNIHVQDGSPPRVKECPESTTVVATDEDLTYAEVYWEEPTFEDNIRVHEIKTSHKSGSKFPVGQHIVTYKGRDLAGHTTHCIFVVTVVAKTQN